MSRGPPSRTSRKEERKNARLAKKQRNSLHHQKMIDTRKSNLPIKPVTKSVTISAKPSNSQTTKTISKPQKSKKKPISMSDVDEEDDEEISSDFDLNEMSEIEEEEVEEKPKKSKKKSSKKSKKYSESEIEVDGDEDDFLSMMDKAFSSGKLTKDGLLGKNGKIDSGKFVSSGDEEDFEEDEDILMESGDEESSEKSESEQEEEIVKEEILQEEEAAPRKKSHSMLRKAPQAQATPNPVQPIENPKLLRQIQSLVNKLGSSNLVPICNEFEGIFRSNRRKEVIELLTETMISSIVRPGGNLLDSFALNFAALAFIINHMVGIEFGAHLIEKLIETIDSLYIQSKSSAEPSDDTNIHERSLVNCMNFCSF